MYLKSIELLGFKSFTGKTKILLEPGISCIVGPNGSGKSNIADALRWVMGEQSTRTIRGGKLEDVIFSGTRKRRALGMAEVTITLDNSDGYLPLEFTEVMVTRRAIRGGASEYYINSQPCRLKDIRDLFVDTGVGVAGVSLIDQGRVNEMVSCRPEDRRSLVEEAAGIVKYRDRKREAARKLEETERHLERLGDIIGELESRIEPLGLQAEKARAYLGLQEEADRMEIGVSVRVLSEAEDKISGYDRQIARLEQELLEDESLRLAAVAQTEELRLQLSAIDQEVAEASREYYDFQTSREKAEGELNTAQVQLDNAESNRARWEGELEQLTQSLAAHKAEAEALEEHIRRTAQELADYEQSLLRGDGGGDDLREAATLRQEQLAQARKDTAALAAELAAINNKTEFSQQLADKNQAARDKLAEEEAQLRQEGAALQEQQQAVQERLADLSGQSKAAGSALNESEVLLRQLSAEQQQQAEEEADRRYQVHSLQTKVAMLEEMNAGYEGFFPGVRGLMKAHRQGQAPRGVLGVMAELMEAPPQYRVAIEAFLGANLQNIVVEDGQAAKAAVAYLKKHQSGRATFLPLDILQVRQPRDMSAALSMPGVFGRGSELVGCEERYRPAVDFLLNNVLICKDLDIALAAAARLKYKVSLVTLEGDLVSPGAAVSGGSRQAKAGDLLGQKARLTEAQKELADAQEALAGQEQRMEALRASMRQASADNEKAREQLKALSAAIAEQSSLGDNCRTRWEGLSQRLAAVERELRELAQEGELASSELAAALEEQERLSQAAAEAAGRVEEAEEALELIQQQLDEHREDVTERKMALASSREKLHGQSLTLERLHKEIEDLSWEAESRSADRDQAMQEQAAYGAQIAAGKEALLRLSGQLHDAEQRMEAVRHGYAAETARLQELERQDREHLREQDKIKTELHQQQLRRERWQADFENEAGKLAEKFQLDLAMAQAKLGEDIPSRTAMAQRLNQLRREIAALGTVNVGAIEEYQEVSQRFTFLSSQREDMLEARAKLDMVIQEMDGIMTSRFRTAFQQLNAAFHASFRRLFGGGEAELILSDPEDILGTGVEIAVHPPGKRVANYNLLSGGEKSLIGIALMFATLAVRPTPFCFMDEVDAALDEANIDRFTAYLRDESRDSQFVMITHRQGTMDAATSLWGVTMEEEGVSKVIGVRMKDSLPAPADAVGA